MATTSSTATTTKSANTRKSSASGSTSRSSAGTRRTTTRRRSTSTAGPRTTFAQAQHLAERAILVPVGASLLAQENLVSSVRGLATKYRTRAGVQRELRRYERRGATARNRFERQVGRTRTRFERELRQGRSSLGRTVKQNRRRLEREVRSVRRDPAGAVSAGAARLIANAQELISSAS